MMFPTARDARPFPAAAAMSPYVATRPGGIRRTTDNTRPRNISEPDADARPRLCAAGIGRDAVRAIEAEIDLAPRESHQRRRAEAPRQHPADLCAGIEAWRRLPCARSGRAPEGGGVERK